MSPATSPSNDEFWYCVRHHRVEGPEGCPNKDRLGPYPTQAEAADALAKVQERNEAWDQDPRFNDDVEQRPQGEG